MAEEEKRAISNDKGKTRVRYAPSPTGMQHIGGVRTALFNYLFARSLGGKFILRLEDTDRTRYDEKFVKNLFDSMEWLGLDWDEGGSKGGPCAPYIQSERFLLYQNAAKELVEKGEAYYCFCNAARLERIKKIQTENKMAPGYDRACRHLTKDEVAENLAAGLPHVIRLKVPLEGAVKFHDALLGDIEWKCADISPDPVLLKSDGFPTYHLANVVDDHLMGITHVLRAQEWIPSTPLHVQMYRAFGWEPPVFCHLPMVNGQDGQKLSKRHGSTSINEFRARGYLPQAIINYVALLGCSYIEGKELYTLEELEKAFKLEHLNKSPAVFDYKKLEWFNAQYIRAMTDEDLFSATLPFITGKCLKVTGDNSEKGIPLVGSLYSGVEEDGNGLLHCTEKGFGDLSDSEIREKILFVMPLIKERLRYLTEAAQMVHFIFSTPAIKDSGELIPKKLDAKKTKEVLEKSFDFIVKIFNSSHDEAEGWAKGAAESLGIKLGDFMMPVRIAVTGSRVSPPLIGSIKILGKDEAIKRVQTAITLL